MFRPADPLALHFSTLKKRSFKEDRLVWGLAPGPELSGGAEVPTEKRKKPKEGRENESSEKEMARLKAEVTIDQRVNKLLDEKKNEIKAFIQKHQVLSGTVEEWNRDFLESIGNPDSTYFKIELLQSTLFRRLGLKKDRRAIVDGKLGPYTLSALAVYTGNELPDFTRLGSNIKPKLVEGADALNEWMDYADKDLPPQRMLDTPKEDLFQAFEASLTPEDLSTSVGTLEGEATELFYKNLERVILENDGKIDTSTADGWRQAFKKAGLSDVEIEEMGLSANPPDRQSSDSTENTPPQNRGLSQEVSKAVVETATASLDKNEVNEEVKKRAAIVESSNETVKSAVKAYNNYLEGILNAMSVSKDEVLRDLSESQYNPEMWFNDIRGKHGPEEALEAYIKAYNKWNRAVLGGVGIGNLETEKTAAYDKLKKAVHQYYNKMEVVEREILQLYKERLTEMVKKYELPKELPLEQIRDPNNIYSSPFVRGLKQLNNIEIYVGRYFNKMNPPEKAVHSTKDCEKYLIGNDDTDRETNAKTVWSIIESGGYNPAEVISNWTYITNIRSFAKEHQALMVEMAQERGRKISDFPHKSLEELLK